MSFRYTLKVDFLFPIFALPSFFSMGKKKLTIECARKSSCLASHWMMHPTDRCTTLRQKFWWTQTSTRFTLQKGCLILDSFITECFNGYCSGVLVLTFLKNINKILQPFNSLETIFIKSVHMKVMADQLFVRYQLAFLYLCFHFLVGCYFYVGKRLYNVSPDCLKRSICKRLIIFFIKSHAASR